MEPPVVVLVEEWCAAGHGIAVLCARHPFGERATTPGAIPIVGSGGSREEVTCKEEAVGGVHPLQKDPLGQSDGQAACTIRVAVRVIQARRVRVVAASIVAVVAVWPRFSARHSWFLGQMARQTIVVDEDGGAKLRRRIRSAVKCALREEEGRGKWRQPPPENIVVE